MPRSGVDAPCKQRHTVTRIFHRPVEEHGADVSYGMVRYPSRSGSPRSWSSTNPATWNSTVTVPNSSSRS